MPGILVVDDEPLQRDILKTILEDCGYEIRTASSGEDAVKISREFNPDIILTDPQAWRYERCRASWRSAKR